MIKVYRIEHPDNKDGMWYNTNGEPKKQIHKLCPDGIAKDLPMPLNPLHQKDSKQWCSAGKSVEQMRYWFTGEDAISLLSHGFKLYEFGVPEVQELEHEVLFCRDEVLLINEIEVAEVWEINEAV